MSAVPGPDTSAELDVLAPGPAGSPSSGPQVQEAIRGRSLGEIAWRRLRRDKVAMTGGIVVVVLIVLAIFAPLICNLLGLSPTEFNYKLVDADTQMPKGGWGGMSWDHPLGVEPINGRDLLARVLYGARISLIIAFLATMLSVVIGTIMGIVAGFFGGWIDSAIARLMDIFLAFPLIVFALAIVGALPDKAFGLSGESLRIALLVFIIGFFNWPYIGRIVRGQTLSIRNREFVDAAVSLGATPRHLLLKELLPNLVAPILVYATLLIPSNILFEAALSFLGVGVQPPTPTWGGMLTQAGQWYQVNPQFMFPPGLAIFFTVLAFNLFGDGLRDALDPRSR